MKRFAILAAIASILLSCTAKEVTISVDGPKEYALSASRVALLIRVVSTAPNNYWTYDTGGAAWLSEASVTADQLRLDVAPNESPLAREATVTLYAGEVGSPVSTTVFVRQAGAEVEPAITAPDSFEIAADAGTAQIDISTNQGSWEPELMSGAEWLKMEVAAGKLQLEAIANPTEDVRNARIRIYAPSKAAAIVFKDIAVVQAANVIEYDPVNLSESATANCYIITHRGEYSFNATVKGNGSATKGLAAPSALAPSGVRLVWQTVKDMITYLQFKDGYISFQASKAAGSAVIAATGADGRIIWSWHIWHPSAPIEELRNVTGSMMMNMNLGALDCSENKISSHGMLYQWGRKDPFPYSPVSSNGSIATLPINVYDASGAKVKIGSTDRYSLKDNTLAFSIANPDVCISNNYQASVTRDWLTPAESNVALWGNPDGMVRSGGAYRNAGAKSYYDPCPPGWRVASVGEYVHFSESGGYTWATGDTMTGLEFADLGGPAEVAVVDYNEDGKYTLADYVGGWWMWLDKKSGVKSYFPAATRYDGGYAMLMGSMVGLWGNYWTNAASDEALTGGAAAFAFSLKDYNLEYQITVSPVSNGSRADAYSVRCIKE